MGDFSFSKNLYRYIANSLRIILTLVVSISPEATQISRSVSRPLKFFVELHTSVCINGSDKERENCLKTVIIKTEPIFIKIY